MMMIILLIPGYNLFREDHLLKLNEEVFVFTTKILFPLKIKKNHYLQKCIHFEISRDQCQDDFDLNSVMVNNPFLTHCKIDSLVQ